jgi:hypothetical protein
MTGTPGFEAGRESEPQRLKPGFRGSSVGTAEAVPFRMMSRGPSVGRHALHPEPTGRPREAVKGHANGLAGHCS